MTTFHPLPPHPKVVNTNTTTWPFQSRGGNRKAKVVNSSSARPNESRSKDKTSSLSSCLGYLGAGKSNTSASDSPSSHSRSPWWKFKGSKKADGWIKVVPADTYEDEVDEDVVGEAAQGSESVSQPKTTSKPTKSVTWSDSTDTFVSSSAPTTTNSPAPKSKTKSALKITTTSNSNQKMELKKDTKALKKEAKKQKRDEERRKRQQQLEEEYWYQQYDYEEWRDHMDAYRWAAVLYAL